MKPYEAMARECALCGEWRDWGDTQPIPGPYDDQFQCDWCVNE